MKNKVLIKYLITGLILFVSIYFAIDGINFAELFEILKTINWFWVILPMPIVILSHLARAFRWRTFLSPFHKAKSILNLFSATIVGYLLNNITPRGGEFVRPYIYSKREGISYSSTFATIIVERFTDLVTLGLITSFIFIVNRDNIANAFPANTDPMVLIYISLIILFVLVLSIYPPFVNFILRVFIKPISPSIAEKLKELFEKFRTGLVIIKSPSKYLQISFESFLIWLLYALPLYILFFAFNFHEQYNLGIYDAVLLVVVSGIGVTIAPTPGAIGVYHYLIQIALSQLYGMKMELGLAFATVAHAQAKIIELLVGTLFFIRENAKKDLLINNSESEKVN